MTYSYPPPSAVSASWSGAQAHAYPVHTDAGASWFAGHIAQGFSQTQFGTPKFSPGAPDLIGDASGWVASAFGGPSIIPSAVGFAPVMFGAPSVQLEAVGFSPVAFGVPSGSSVLRASSLGVVTQFGAPLALGVDQTGRAEGFTSRFGTHYGWVIGEVLRHTLCAATGFLATRFGGATSPVKQQGIATGYRSTRFGVPVVGPAPLAKFGAHTGAMQQPAAGASTTAFGIPSASVGASASGFAASRFGAPTSAREQAATGFCPTRFGAPSGGHADAHRTYGFRQTWFGHPRAVQNVNYASGECATRFGTPSSQDVHIACHIPPGTRFGTPLMKRFI